MKKSTIILICILVITTLISCSYTHPPICSPVTGEESSTANTDESQRDTTNELPDWLEGYIPPLSNQEMMKYGYDENGELVLTEDQLEHVEDIYCDSSGGVLDIANGPISFMFDYYLKYAEASVVLVGTVQTITSKCTRFEDLVTAGYEDKIYDLIHVYYRGYTETVFQITDVLDVHICDTANDDQSQALKKALMGKTITIKQTPFWYIDDNGDQKKGENIGYTYVLAPNQPAVVWLCNWPEYGDDKGFNQMTFEEQLQTFETLKWQVEDYYPLVNENGEPIDTFEKFTTYLSYLEGIGITYPINYTKDLHPKVQISY